MIGGQRLRVIAKWPAQQSAHGGRRLARSFALGVDAAGGFGRFAEKNLHLCIFGGAQHDFVRRRSRRRILVWHCRHARCSWAGTSSKGRKKRPVIDSLARATNSGVPWATTRPPASAAPGPKSIR